MSVQNAHRGFWERYERQLAVRETLARKVLAVLLFLVDNGMALRIKAVAGGVNRLVEAEGYGDVRVTPKRIGVVVRRELGLNTRRGSTRARRYEVIWDDGRRAELRERFGLNDGALGQIWGRLIYVKRDA